MGFMESMGWLRKPFFIWQHRDRRITDHKDLIFSHYNDRQQAFLDFVLSQYVNEGVSELQAEKLPALIDLKYQSIHDATQELGEVSRIRDLFAGFQRHLFEEKKEA
jgi:type I restriction enzyme R subunit